MFDFSDDEDCVEWSDYLIAKSQRCHRKTWMYFVQNGDIPKEANGQWCLHHIDPTMKYFDQSRYVEWNVEDVMPMTVSEHLKLHHDFIRRNKEYGFLDKLMSNAMNASCKANRHH